MKGSLLERPNLFATPDSNFKAKIQSPYDIDLPLEGEILNIIGYVSADNVFILQNDNISDHAGIEQVKLIARPIEDMTDEEIIDFEGSLINVDRKIALRVIEDTDRLEAWGMLNLLSIGVYPFDQSHFEDGTVIDSRTINQ